MYKGEKYMKNSDLKKGITLISIAIYIVLFTIFTAFIANVSGNLNDRLFNNRGAAINYTNLNKLQYNILKSASVSYDVNNTLTDINYSNGDRYSYNGDKKIVYKNDGILCTNVSSFAITTVQGLDNTKLEITVSFNKYLNTLERSIISVVEEY